MLKEQFSALEEARADLVALYFLPDPKLVELGLVAQADHQTRSCGPSTRRTRATRSCSCAASARARSIEEDHMRNRQMIVRWLMANTKAIETRTRDGKTYYVMTDPRRVPRRRRHGCSPRCSASRPRATTRRRKPLFETYGVHFDPTLRDEVVARVDTLNLPSYTGFVMPKLDAVKGNSGEITDVTISYPQDLTTQMLEYSAATRPLRR